MRRALRRTVGGVVPVRGGVQGDAHAPVEGIVEADMCGKRARTTSADVAGAASSRVAPSSCPRRAPPRLPAPRLDAEGAIRATPPPTSRDARSDEARRRSPHEKRRDTSSSSSCTSGARVASAPL